jgi:hypothetical protein
VWRAAGGLPLASSVDSSCLVGLWPLYLDLSKQQVKVGACFVLLRSDNPSFTYLIILVRVLGLFYDNQLQAANTMVVWSCADFMK